jgi:hypothetical protein
LKVANTTVAGPGGTKNSFHNDGRWR